MSLAFGIIAIMIIAYSRGRIDMREQLENSSKPVLEKENNK